MSNVLVFYKNRIRRILPAYVFSVCLLILFVFIRSDFCVRVSTSELAKQIFSWFLMGANGSPDINGVGSTGVMNAFVFWTLKYEFYFYLSLPLLSLFSKPLHFVVVGAVITLYYTWYIQEYVVLYFIVGAAFVYLNKIEFISVIMKGYVGLGVLIISVFAYFSLCDTAYSWTGVIMSLPILLAIFNGNSILGFLTSRPVRFLGVISYSLYVLHGLVIYVVYSFISEHANLSLLSVLILMVFLSLLASTLLYLKVERTFINKRLVI
ncbi:TPA: acyltransferase family protein [Aeromonas veronii]